MYSISLKVSIRYNTDMTILQSILLGLIQGLTEFIPVSSSGHLVLAQHFMGIEPSLTFESLVNLGTLLALLAYFHKRIWNILLRLINERDFRLTRNLIISAIPVGVVGILGKGFFESAAVQAPIVVCVMLISVGLVMVFLDKLPMLSRLKTLDQLSPKRAGIIGLAQVISLLPGASRSASTMIASKLMGFDYRQAAEYSFLLSIPVIGAVVLINMVSPEGVGYIQNNFGSWLASNIAAFVGGFVAVSFMLKFLAKGNFKVFGYYRIGLAAIILAILAI